MRESIDINCDLGEGCGNDAELMKYISSANIACGGHAGNLQMMRRTVELAIANNVAIGAHPGYADQQNFGRIAIDLNPDEIFDTVANQIQKLQEVGNDLGAAVVHVKPHGALYNLSAKDPTVAAAVAEAVKAADADMILFGLSGSHSITEAKRIGLRTASEAFADRTYQNDGSLTPRTEVNALIRDPATSIEQVLDMIRYGRVRTTEAVMIQITAETICIHGDATHAVDFARSIKSALAENAIAIEKP